jgi:ethanolamine ammonia-lyase small subunit
VSQQSSLQPDPWHRLRQLTPARIALGRAGGSLPTRALLDFQLSHALARDAVHQPFDPQRLERDIAPLNHSVIHLNSAVADRQTYLVRPDLGGRLSDDSRAELAQHTKPCEVSIVLSDGLSALAAHRQIPSLIAHLLPLLKSLELASIAIVPFSRVAIQDEIGKLQQARLSLILLGERPGLGAPDSLGAYLVFNPRPGLTNADRNCVSNIRPQGLPPTAAAEFIHYLIRQSLLRQISGVALKDDRSPGALSR